MKSIDRSEKIAAYKHALSTMSSGMINYKSSDFIYKMAYDINNMKHK